MRWIGRTLLLAVVATSVTVAGLAVVTPAHASCVASPLVSRYKFAGTVTQVANQGRTAVVLTDDGRTVTVRGSDVEGTAATSVDRVYQVGLRYEFHPLNDSSPYQDNACTATHPIGAGRTDISGAVPKSDKNGAIQPAGGRRYWPWWLGAVGVLAAATTVSVLTLRRRGSRRG